MKIGIITITQGTNYGNRLQIYAVQRVLEKMGYESRLILNQTGVNSVKHRLKKMVKIALGIKSSREDYYREKSYKIFDKKYLRIEKKSLDENYGKSKLGFKYDVFLCGSDQVWNPYTPYMNGIFFADIPGVRKRIAYAASFGVDVIPNEMVKQYSYWLNQFQEISVREESGKQIVDALSNKRATVLLDPTMLLDPAEWEKLEEMPEEFMHKKYVFIYFLGEINVKIKTFIEKTCEENRFELVDVLPAEYEKNYKFNPSHFVYLLHHAELVITDSFHAVVFSILFQKQFRVFDRVHGKVNMSSRLDTLLSYFELAEYRNNFESFGRRSVRYNVLEKLAIRREESLSFLEKALKEEI